MGKYIVKNEKTIDVNELGILEIKTRETIAYGVLIVCAIAITISCLYGMWINDFSGVKDVMIYVLPIITYILGYYFSGHNRNETINHNKSSNGTP